MVNTSTENLPLTGRPDGVAAPALTTRRSSLAVLLGTIDEAPVRSAGDRHVDVLVQRRLGISASLFRALRAKHAATANHCLRVALRCSIFGSAVNLSDEEVDQIEIAALLHDIGKIGVPDAVLTKPGPLDDAEQQQMIRQRRCGLEILSASCTDQRIIDIIEFSPVPYDKRDQITRNGCPVEQPIGARILNIADAFDAMTTDHVYRHAMSRERAISELFKNAGTQFDPFLVREFAKMSSSAEAEINQQISDRWIHQLSPSAADTLWQLQQPLYANVGQPSAQSLFQQQLLDAMHDGVAFIDSSCRILLWNSGAERLTGISPQSVYEKTWSTEMLEMRDREDNLIRENHCPVRNVIRTGAQSLRRVTISNQRRERTTVDIHVIPVVDEHRRCYGATMLIHDASSETDLEERVQDLHEQATTDPLTGVGNRAEFERRHQRLVETSLAAGVQSSIILCDIDRFKSINDVYGHQAGDQALISFATLLQAACRHGDLVSRYGGEEFVILCQGCDNATAARRAEEIRRELAQTPQSALDGRCMTSSFGVTELQPGDTTETMLRRADRALYQAKENGRNRVVQLGAGIVLSDDEGRSGWLSWIRGQRKTKDDLSKTTLIANVPISVLAEKIRGFISDHHAEIIRIEEDHVHLQVKTNRMATTETNGKNTTLIIQLDLREQESLNEDEKRTNSRTLIDVKIGSLKKGDRRLYNDAAQHVLMSLKSYLIAQDYFAD